MQLVRHSIVPILFFAMIAFMCGAIAAPAALSPTELRFVNAEVTARIASSLRSKTIPNDLKMTLLESARSEDKAFAKDIVVHWKAYQDKNLHAEFDELVVQDADGKEIFRIRALTSPENSFLINGRSWTVPKSGSIRTSLEEHLGRNATALHSEHARSSIFALILSPRNAFAASPSRDLTAVAYVYVKSHPSGSAAFSLKNAAEFSGRHLARSFLEDLFNSPTKIQCDGTTARGVAVIDGQNIPFESRADASLILTMNNIVQTKLLVRSAISPIPGAILIHEKMVVTRCYDSSCSKVDKHSVHETPLAWIAHEKASTEDAQGMEVAFAKSAMAALRPLGACCGDKSCREGLAERNIEFVPTSSGRTNR